MRLKKLIKSADIADDQQYLSNFEVKGISPDSRNIKKNFIFVAIKGINEDGHKFIDEAIQRGARAIILQNPKFQNPPRAAYQISTRTRCEANPKGASFICVKNTRQALARLAVEFYGNPSSKMKVVGITGTNGKTTVSYLLEAIVREAGFEPAVIGTINHHFRNKFIPSKNTTPGPLELQSLLADMTRDRIDYVAMEVSSHALDQGRVGGINFHSAIFTNLTQDHLDYHATIENYFQAKTKLFSNINPLLFAVINNDDRYGVRLKRLIQAKIITYGIKRKSDITASNLHFDISHTKFCLMTKRKKIDIKTNLIGRHNVYNVLAASAWAIGEGLDLKIISLGLKRFSIVPGRLERINTPADLSIFLDYAHTHDALANVIRSLRQLSRKHIIVVFGCGGERDKLKRPKMGRVVSELADYAIITNDNPRSEDPLGIIQDIKKGINKDNYSVIPDRFQAIKESLGMAKKGDTILLAGKGHENYQILKEGKIYFDDREAIKECLRAMNY